MEISSKYVGGVSRPIIHDVTWRETMNYAAAVGDNNPRYFDDEREDGLIAPPLFAVALTWPFGRDASDYWDPQDFPLELLTRQVHYIEHITFHRLVRPGDSLTIRGDIASITPHRAGAIASIRCRAVDAAGNPVFTEYAGTLLRDVKCTDKGRGKEELPAVPKGPTGGEPIWTVQLRVDPMAPFIYDGAADMFNPIHTSRRFAKSVGLPGIIVHGTCTLAWAARELVNREAGGDPARLREIGCRFSGMVPPGSTVTIRLRGADKSNDATQLFFDVLSGDGRRAITDGYALLK